MSLAARMGPPGSLFLVSIVRQAGACGDAGRGGLCRRVPSGGGAPSDDGARLPGAVAIPSDDGARLSGPGASCSTRWRIAPAGTALPTDRPLGVDRLCSTPLVKKRRKCECA